MGFGQAHKVSWRPFPGDPNTASNGRKWAGLSGEKNSFLASAFLDHSPGVSHFTFLVPRFPPLCNVKGYSHFWIPVQWGLNGHSGVPTIRPQLRPLTPSSIVQIPLSPVPYIYLFLWLFPLQTPTGFSNFPSVSLKLTLSSSLLLTQHQ